MASVGGAWEHTLRFEVEWEDAPGVRARELRSTWGRLEIWIDDECVTQSEDSTTREVSRSLYGSIYPLAEWIAFNWWFLEADARPLSYLVGYRARPGVEREALPWPGWEHHSVRAAGEGFAWPDLRIVPQGDLTLMDWRRDRGRPRHRAVRFIGDGRVWLPRDQVMAALVRLVEAVIERLETRGLETVLTREWDAVRSTSGEERDFCLAAARLGRDPYALDPSVATAIVDAGTHIGGPGLRDFFDAADPDRIPESVAWFRRAQARISRLSGNGVLPTQTQIQGGSELRESRYPWEAGYQDALNFRTALGVEPTGRFDIEEFVPHLVETAPSGRLHAAGGFSTAGTPVVVSGRSMGAAASRFLLARGLWFALTPGDAAGFLVTGAHTARQQAARAFAAELLAPAAGIVELAELGDTGEILDDDVDRVARTFGVSAAVVQRQIENQVLRFEDYRLDDG